MTEYFQEDRHRMEASWRREEKTQQREGKQGDETTAYLHADDSVYEE